MSTDKVDEASGDQVSADQVSADEATLDSVRGRIDAIDRELQRLLNERAACALSVAHIKHAEPGDQPPVFYRPEREAQILARIKQENQGPLSDDDLARLFREIISCCLNLEQPLTIAYLGPPGTYTEAAAVKQFGHFAGIRALASIDEVFREVESEGAHYGVVPVENSTEGMVNHTLDCFMDSPVLICAEVELPIHHALLVNARAVDDPAGEPVTEILSHAQSLAQCRGWLDAHYPGTPRVPVNSNAEAARLVAERPGAAAIAGEVAADRYGLRILATRIEDHPDNKTRFLVIGRQRVGVSGRDKTSILVSTRNEPGALYKVLEPFHKHGISLTRIETRPAKSGSWSYVFFIDFDGHHSEARIRTVLDEVAQVAMEVRSLGSYPQAVV
jgi:chorismate mutase/prephenate dehydratase